MTSETYEYAFGPQADMSQVEETLLLATMAAEGLHGRARVRLEAGFRCDPASRTARVEGGTDVGEAIARIFTALLASTIGEQSFSIAHGLDPAQTR